jgi:hypothetical protein
MTRTLVAVTSGITVAFAAPAVAVAEAPPRPPIPLRASVAPMVVLCKPPFAAEPAPSASRAEVKLLCAKYGQRPGVGPSRIRRMLHRGLRAAGIATLVGYPGKAGLTNAGRALRSKRPTSVQVA